MSVLPSPTVSSATKTSPPAISDISHRAHNLAKIIDRLWPGTYQLKIVKNEIESADWDVEIIRSEMIQRVSLKNKSYVAE